MSTGTQRTSHLLWAGNAGPLTAPVITVTHHSVGQSRDALQRLVPGDTTVVRIDGCSPAAALDLVSSCRSMVSSGVRVRALATIADCRSVARIAIEDGYADLLRADCWEADLRRAPVALPITDLRATRYCECVRCMALWNHLCNGLFAERYGDPRKQPSLTSRTCQSPTSLRRSLRELFGERPHAAIVGYRLELAARLRAAGYSQRLVGHVLGHSDAHGLNAAFRRVHGTSLEQCAATIEAAARGSP